MNLRALVILMSILTLGMPGLALCQQAIKSGVFNPVKTATMVDQTAPTRKIPNVPMQNNSDTIGLKSEIMNMSTGCKQVNMTCKCLSNGILNFTSEIPAPDGTKKFICLAESQWGAMNSGLGQVICGTHAKLYSEDGLHPQETPDACDFVSASCVEPCYFVH